MAKRADRIGEHRTAYDRNRQIILHTQTVCGICGKPVDFEFKYPHPLSPTVDHIVPIKKGGHPSALSNLQLAHRWCNRWKSDKLIETTRSDEQKQESIGNKNLPQSFDWKNFKATTADT